MSETSLLSITQPSLMNQVNQHGSRSAPHFQKIAENFQYLDSTDIADTAHFLCVLHGRHPGVIDHAATKTVESAARNWLVQAMEAFTAERAFLTKLTVAAGPISGVSATDQSNAAVLAQRKALELLSQSDRKGCALGAAFALVLDWQAIRPQLELIALRLGVEPRPDILPSIESTEALNMTLTQSAGIGRAINFGVDQVVGQHRGLWQLLESRKKARIID